MRQHGSHDWWMMNVIYVDCDARSLKVPPLFQIAVVETEVVGWLCADVVTHIVPCC